jgi:hypothetical protein
MINRYIEDFKAKIDNISHMKSLATKMPNRPVAAWQGALKSIEEFRGRQASDIPDDVAESVAGQNILVDLRISELLDSAAKLFDRARRQPAAIAEDRPPRRFTDRGYLEGILVVSTVGRHESSPLCSRNLAASCIRRTGWVIYSSNSLSMVQPAFPPAGATTNPYSRRRR